MQGCQKNRTNLNCNLIRELVRRFFHWYFLSKAACWIVQIVSRESSETWAYAKKCWKIEKRRNTQSHRFFTISFIFLPYTIVSFGGLPNNKSKWGWLIMQGCQKIRTNLNRNLSRELVRRFFHWYFCLRPRVELYKLSHEKVQKRELMPKNNKKIEIFYAICWNI